MTKNNEKGKSYNNPKRLGDYAEEGDIFQITTFDLMEYDIKYPYGLFYIAKFSGDTSSMTIYDYPAYGEPDTNNENWKHAWTKITDFQLLLENSEPTATIYSNGIQQVGIRFLIEAVDDSGTPIPLSKEVMLSAFSKGLINYINDNDYLDANWLVSAELNDFYDIETSITSGTITQGTDNKNINIISILTQYLSCTNIYTTMKLGASLILPNGTLINNWAGSVEYHTPISITVQIPTTYNSGNTATTVQGFDTDQETSYNYYNFYFRIREDNAYIVKADITLDGVEAYADGEYDQYIEWSVVSKNEHPRKHRIAPFDPVGKIAFSEFYFNDADDSDGSDNYDPYYMTYNAQDNAVCVGRLWIDTNSGYENYYYNTHITIYDQYGNSDKFTAVRGSDWGSTINIVPGFVNSSGI